MAEIKMLNSTCQFFFLLFSQYKRDCTRPDSWIEVVSIWKWCEPDEQGRCNHSNVSKGVSQHMQKDLWIFIISSLRQEQKNYFIF